ncbi:MAG: saccharopine dehydrogenase NADP-binding domain-containing protein [Planctomycetales bacterium]|nr:saccharopine dehydrogenase NADP-binding domain-containing protein [Planctomycetales bacterium]
MHRVLLLGSGKIGRMIAKLLTDSGDYLVTAADVDPASLARLQEVAGAETQRLDATDQRALVQTMRHYDCVISALSFHHNPTVARAALEAGISYFDLTEDIETTNQVREVAAQARPGQLFAPQCGLAPGFVSIAAHHLTTFFDELDTVHMRVGALPQFPTGALKYNLTWSTDGLINEYCNPCEAIHDHRRVEILPLEGFENFSLDGVRYEAFNTSGGLGSMCETLSGRVRELNYKTIRYQGHRDLMTFLIHELRMRDDRDNLKTILERSVPVTWQDVVVVFCNVSGRRKGQLVKMSDARKIYQQEIDGARWSAIQITTASGICAAVDLHATGKLKAQGFLRQEEIGLEQFLNNRFGACYRSQTASKYASHESE